MGASNATTPATLLERLGAVQTALKAPKGQMNSFGGYKYRSTEDILEALKPLLADNALTLTISDELVNIGERYYVKATASVYTSELTERTESGPLGSYTVRDKASAYGYAREEETKKGMDGSQITGASSSYARKYALNGLFLIDDTKDSDATNDHDKGEKAASAAYRPPAAPAHPAAAQTVLGGSGGVKPGLINPASMTELKTLMAEKKYNAETSVEFAEFVLGKPKPESESEVQEMLATLRGGKEVDDFKGEEPFS